MARIPFPNVPRLPGVPQLPRSIQFPPGPPAALSGVIALGRLFSALFAKPTWGIYAQPPQTQPADDADPDALPEVVVRSDPQPVVQPDSIVDFNYRQEWSVSDYPTAPGGFASYNKVDSPYEMQLRLSKGGSERQRAEFIAQIEAIAGTVDLYKIVTPERTYSNVNVTRYEVTRQGAEGAFFLSKVDLYFREVRLVYPEYTTTAANTVNAADPDARPVVNAGTVGAKVAPPSLLERVRNRAGELARAALGRGL